jgi:hypothetical protein
MAQAPTRVKFLHERRIGNVGWHVAGKDCHNAHLLVSSNELRDLPATRKHDIVEMRGEVEIEHGDRDRERLAC